MTRKVKLSTLVDEYLKNGHIDYAAILYIAARHGEITLDKIYKICQRRSKSGIRSWLTYMTKSEILKRKAKATYTLGPALDPDLDETAKIFNRHGVDPDKILKKLQEERQEIVLLNPRDINTILNLLEQHIPGIGKIVELYRKHGVRLLEFERMLQELARLRTENVTLQEEVQKLRKVVEEYEAKVRELEGKLQEVVKTRQVYADLLEKIPEDFRKFLEVAVRYRKHTKLLMFLETENGEYYDKPVEDLDYLSELVKYIGTRQEFYDDKGRKRRGILDRVCLCIEKPSS